MRGYFRVDVNVSRNEKIIGLSDDKVRWTYMLLLAEGKLQPRQGSWKSMKHLAGCVPSRPEKHLRELAAAHLLEVLDDGTVTVHDWDDWQSAFPSDSTASQRQRRHRLRCHGAVTQQSLGDVTVLSRDSHGHTETETETLRSSSQSSELVQPAVGESDAPRPDVAAPEPSKGPDPPDEDPEEPPGGPTKAEIRSVYEHYLQVMGFQEGEYQLTPSRRRTIRTRLTEYTPDALCLAIDRCRASPFHMGEMDKTNGATFNELDKHVLRSKEKVEGWLRRRNGNEKAQRV